MSAGGRDSIEEMIAILKREIGLRERLIPKWNVSGENYRKWVRAMLNKELKHAQQIDALRRQLAQLEMKNGAN